MQTAELGHFSLTVNNQSFKLKPSFRNMANLGSSKELMLMLRTLHNPAALNRTLVNLSREVLLTCSDRKKIKKYLVSHQGNEMQFSDNSISAKDQVQVAAALMRHGVCGVNRPKNGLKPSSGKVDELDIYKHVAEANKHFNMTLSEAWDLTMTEFSYHIAAAFPPKSAGSTAPSMEAHKAAMMAAQQKNGGKK